MDTYTVRLTEEQVRLIRRVLSEKALFVKVHPLPEDGDLYERLCDADKPLYAISQCF